MNTARINRFDLEAMTMRLNQLNDNDGYIFYFDGERIELHEYDSLGPMPARRFASSVDPLGTLRYLETCGDEMRNFGIPFNVVFLATQPHDEREGALSASEHSSGYQCTRCADAEEGCF